MNTLIKKRLGLWCVAFVAVLVGSIADASPFTINYGGRLVESSGKPVTGPVDLELKLYRVAAGGSPVAVPLPVLSDVPLKQGVFSIELPLDPSDFDTVFDSTQDVWIEVKDLTHGVTYPRQRFSAVPYALRVPIDDTSIRYDNSGRLTVGTVPSATNATTADHATTADTATSAEQINTIPVQPGTPGDGKILKYSDTNNRWEFADDASEPGAGEVNTGTSLGGTAAVFKSKNLLELQFRGLSAGPGASVTQNANDITIGANVTTVAGRTGAVTLSADDVAETFGRKWMSPADQSKLSGIAAGADVTDAATVSAAGAVMDSDFGANGLMSRTGAGAYSVVTDNSSNWNTAFGWGNHASAGYLTAVPWASPGTIGSTTPSSGTFTTLQANSSVRVRDGDTNYVQIQSPANLAANYTLTLPADDGNNLDVLQTNGSGVLSWVSIPSAPVTTVNTKSGNVVLNTDDVAEGSTNKYFSNTQARAALSATAPVTYNSGTGAISISAATTSNAGSMSASDKTKLDGIAAGADVTNSASVGAAGAVMDSDFGTNGLMSRTGAGAYSVVTDNSSNWNTAFGWGNHASAGYLTAVPWASPGTIGSTTPSSGAFTTLQANSSVRVRDGDTNYVQIQSPANLAANYTLTLPADDGNNLDVLQTNGSGVLSWVSIPSAPVTTVNTKSGNVVLNTDDVAEGSTNKYFSNTQARAALSATAPVTYNSGTGAISISAATTSNAGSMSASDKTKLDGITAGADITNATTVAAAGAVMDSDFGTNGLMSRTGAGTYSVVTNNSSNWNTAFGWGNHASAGYLTAVPWASPGTIGSTTPSTGTFTTLQANSSVRVRDGDTNYVQIQSPANLAANYTLTLPADDGNNLDVLQTNGSGVLAWVPIPSAPVTTVNTKSGNVVLNTDDVAEGSTNKYFSNAQARAALSATAPINYNSGTGAVSISAATTSNAGSMSAADKTKLDSMAMEVLSDHPTLITANFNAAAGYSYYIDLDTAASDVTATLPSSPSTGHTIGLYLAKRNDTHKRKVMLNLNGKKIESTTDADFYALLGEGDHLVLRYTSIGSDAVGWRVERRRTKPQVVFAHGSMSIANNTYTTADLTDTYMDSAGLVDLTNNRIDIRRSGFFLACVSMTTVNPVLDPGEFVEPSFQVNGSTIFNSIGPSGTTNGYVWASRCENIYLFQGQVVTMLVKQSEGATQSVSYEISLNENPW